MHRNNLQRKEGEKRKLRQDKAKEVKKRADIISKIQRAKETINRSTSSGTIKSKTSEIERNQKELVKVEKKIADFEQKIARKEKEIVDEQRKLSREEENENKKCTRDAKKQELKHQNQMSKIDNTLNRHDKLHQETKLALNEIKLPKKIVVLFFAANPLDEEQLRLDEEVRAISKMIQQAKHRDSVKLESCWAVRPVDILQALNEYEPAIVHFSGHGTEGDEIVFQDPSGNAKFVKKEAIVQTMMASSNNIRLVFFNTCYSRNQAEAVTKHVEASIGMNTSISDEAAQIFSSQFYSAISFGHSVKRAFDQAIALLMMEDIPEESVPELFVRAGLSPDKIFIVDSTEE